MTITVDTTTIQIGLPQLRIGASGTYIATTSQALTSSNSIGALDQVEFSSNPLYQNILLRGTTVGAPVKEDTVIFVKFAEITPKNIVLARGGNPFDSSLSNNHSASIPLGIMSDRTLLRVELFYSFPDSRYTMVVILPRAEVTSGGGFAYDKKIGVVVPITIKALRADSTIADGGNAAWDSSPYGKIVFA